MLLRYVKGEKIYIEEYLGEIARPGEDLDLRQDKQFVRHNELIRALNAIFQQAEEKPDKVNRDLLNIIENLLLLSREESHKPKVEILNVAAKIKEGFKFDDSSKVKRSKRLILHEEKPVKIYDRPKVIKGGLYQPPKESSFQADDILSTEFKAWQREQKKQPTNQEGTT